MSKAVLFVTGLGRDLNRAENMKTLYEAYQGEKKYVSLQNWDYTAEMHSGKYGLIVIDVFPTEHRLPTILIWHAIQGGKYIGLDEGKYYKAGQADNIDCIVSAGYGGSELMSRCTGVPMERIMDLGMPRTDRYFSRKKPKKQTDKRIYLYVPTFRNMGETRLPDVNWVWLDKQLTDNELIIVKSHPYGVPHNICGLKHVIEVNKMEASVDWLYDADVVITDYSSIMFDAYLLKKPVVLFEKNAGYLTTRGMYLKYPDEYCSRFARNEQELLEQIRSAKWLRTAEKKCIEYVADACDGHSCERICQLIDEMKG